MNRRVIVSILLVGLVGAGGVVWWNGRDKATQSQSSQTQQQEPETSSESEKAIGQDLAAATIAEAGVDFQYPKSWGNVSFTIQNTRENLPIGIRGTFSENKDVEIMLHEPSLREGYSVGVTGPANVVDWCGDAVDEIYPLFDFQQSCSDTNTNNASSEFMSNVKKLESSNGVEAIQFNSAYVYAYLEPPEDKVSAIGTIARINTAYPTMSLGGLPKDAEGLAVVAHTISRK